jgi:hypothetical protein
MTYHLFVLSSLLSDAELIKNPIEDIFSVCSADDEAETVEGISQVHCREFRRKAGPNRRKGFFKTCLRLLQCVFVPLINGPEMFPRSHAAPPDHAGYRVSEILQPGA